MSVAGTQGSARMSTLERGLARAGVLTSIGTQGELYLLEVITFITCGKDGGQRDDQWKCP